MTEPWALQTPRPLRGDVALPGDKSISHRSFLINALGTGRARVTGCNDGADVASTRAVLRSLGVAISQDADDAWTVRGSEGHLKPPRGALDCGNSGTTLRLLAGLVAAQPFTTTLDGDTSLRSRPMQRIATPLRTMGARVEGHDAGRTPPLVITGGSLRGGEFQLPVASAQVKSCILLAAAAAGIRVVVAEPGASRDHTERMLQAMGADLQVQGHTIALGGRAPLRAVDVDVPADPSAAALLAAAVLAVPDSRVRMAGVALNPTRAGFLDVLQRMGAAVKVDNRSESAGETRGDLEFTWTPKLRSATVSPEEIPALVDEVPALAVIAAFAEGTTHFQGVGELRVKESDRVQSTCDLLASFGIATRAEGDDLWITGGRPRPVGPVPASDDHRMVMASVALALGALAQDGGTVSIPDVAPAAVSFPTYRAVMQELAFG